MRFSAMIDCALFTYAQEILDEKEGKLKGCVYNYGENYDRVGGYPHYLGDLHTVKYNCAYFEPIQLELKLN